MTFTEIGAAVGFLTGIYTLFDRLMKGRPLAYLVATGPATNALLHLHVRNIGQQDVLLRRLFSIPRRYQVSKDHSCEAMSEAEFMALLRPGQEMDFPVFPPLLVRGRSPKSEGSFAIVISWRKVTCTWLPQFPVCVVTSTRTIEQLESAHRVSQ
jgi:hypothetical protein